jgi:hypothetical protein
MARSVSICPPGRKVVTAVELAIFENDTGEGVVAFDLPGQLAYLTSVVNAEEQSDAAAPVASTLPAREGAAMYSAVSGPGGVLSQTVAAPFPFYGS